MLGVVQHVDIRHLAPAPGDHRVRGLVAFGAGAHRLQERGRVQRVSDDAERPGQRAHDPALALRCVGARPGVAKRQAGGLLIAEQGHTDQIGAVAGREGQAPGSDSDIQPSGGQGADDIMDSAAPDEFDVGRLAVSVRAGDPHHFVLVDRRVAQVLPCRQLHAVHHRRSFAEGWSRRSLDAEPPSRGSPHTAPTASVWFGAFAWNGIKT
jgi:hypothetical protein